jgi:hypothetical protein
MAVLAISIGSALLAAIFGFTALRYGDLPARIPIHFGLDGRANSFGPRPTAWMLPLIGLLISGFFGGLFAAREPNVPLLLPVLILAIFLYVQVQMLDAAINGSNRIDQWGIWAGVAAIVLLLATRHVL